MARASKPLDQAALTPCMSFEDAGSPVQLGNLRTIDLVDTAGEVLDLFAEPRQLRRCLLQPPRRLRVTPAPVLRVGLDERLREPSGPSQRPSNQIEHMRGTLLSASRAGPIL